MIRGEPLYSGLYLLRSIRQLSVIVSKVASGILCEAETDFMPLCFFFIISYGFIFSATKKKVTYPLSIAIFQPCC